MKITKIDLLFADPVEDGWRPLFCRVYTDAGIYGDGEVALSYGGVQKAAFGMMQDMAKMLIGEDPLNHEVLWTKLYRGCFWARNGGPVVFGGISAFDIALWDIKGKHYNQPLYKLLGGKQRDSLRAYASQLQNGFPEARKTGATPEDYVAAAKMAVEKGFDAVKINFTTYKEDGTRYPNIEQTGILPQPYLNVIESRIAAVRDAVGPDVDIILENHCYTDVNGAIQMGNMAKKYRIFYFEEPVTPHPELLAKVHQGCGIPVATGERIYSRFQYNRCFEMGGMQVAQPDIGNCGGITEVKKICDLAFIYESSVQIHVCGSPLVTAASLHLEAAIPNFVIHEYNVNTMGPKMTSLTTQNYQPVNGSYSVPELPGISCEISQYAYEHSTVITIE